MTSTVTVSAHCSADKEVKIVIFTDEKNSSITIIQDGESATNSVYDTRTITVHEQLKEQK